MRQLNDGLTSREEALDPDKPVFWRFDSHRDGDKLAKHLLVFIAFLSSALSSSRNAVQYFIEQLNLRDGFASPICDDFTILHLWAFQFARRPRRKSWNYLPFFSRHVDRESCDRLTFLSCARVLNQ